MRKKVITASILVMATFGAGHALAKDHDGHSSKNSFTLESAEWSASRQRLEVKVKSDVRNGHFVVMYNGHSYEMDQKDRGEYRLREAMVCYDDSLTVTADFGKTLSAPVKVTDGSAQGHYCSVSDSGGGQVGTPRDLVVIASNDLGMHCACPGTEYFMLLPPFNTLRAQIIERGDHPKMLGAQDGITVTYRMVENTDESLKNDPYYSTWLANMPKYGFGEGVRADGKVVGVSGATLDGEMTPEAEGWWEVVGVPAYPDATLSPSEDKIMTDPLGGPNRNPYPTAVIEVFDSASGQKLAETSTVVPVAFGGCCSCHLEVTKDNGMAPTSANSFALMGRLHERDSGINFAQMDPDGDGTPGPIRCSACHLDPAMGETVPPGYPGKPVSKYTFSNVLHRWHVENPTVLRYNPDLATDCYACHPGNNVGCFRGVHADKGLWCTDCHGDLNQRVAEHQMDKPWSAETLPKCEKCHQGTGEGGGYLGVFGGEFLNSMGHKSEKVLCSTCHGSPHSLYPSMMPKDNLQPLMIQGSESAIGKCSVCHTNEADSWSVPAHGDSIPTLRGGSTGGGTTPVDVAKELSTTCRSCHGDYSSRVSCTNSKWTAHDGSRVSTEVFAAVSNQLTGSTCQATSGGGSTGGGTTTIDVAKELSTTCRSCHGDYSSRVSCTNSKWTAHDGSRVSTEVFAAVSNQLTGSTCQSSTGGSSDDDATSTTGIDAAQVLKTTCLSCHSDKSRKVSCSNEDWREHRGKRVSESIYQAVNNYLLGRSCN